MPYLVIIVILVIAALCVLGLVFPAYLGFFNILLLGLTLVVLVWYAYDTHRIANQTLESNLRPVILDAPKITI